jgi:hypothetical protein
VWLGATADRKIGVSYIKFSHPALISRVSVFADQYEYTLAQGKSLVGYEFWQIRRFW